MIWVGYRSHAFNAVLAFCIAVVLTRPLGASAGDFLTQPTSAASLGLGTDVVSGAFLVVIVGIVAAFSVHVRRGSRARSGR